MLFNKKNNNTKKCEECSSKISGKYNFCPHCGNSFIDPEEEQKSFGLLGKDDKIENQDMPQEFGFTDKLIGSLFNSVMKSLDKQLRHQLKDMEETDGRTEVRSFPNGVRIKISGPFDQNQGQQPPQKKRQTRVMDDSQIKKMTSLPREKARTHVKRLGDKVLYELTTPGVNSPEDIFVSRLETGYEIKAIGNKKIYVNTIPITLPLKRYSLSKNKLIVEFNQTHDQPHDQPQL